MKKLFGWDLLFKVLKKKINSKSEILVAFVHWCILRQNARCLGCEYENTSEEVSYERGSELLPDGWNKNDAKWTLRYIFKDSLHVLLASKFENIIIFNWLNVKENKTCNAAVDVEIYVEAQDGSIDDIIPKHLDLIHEINNSLFEIITENNTKTIDTQTEDYPLTPANDRSPLLLDPRVHLNRNRNPHFEPLFEPLSFYSEGSRLPSSSNLHERLFANRRYQNKRPRPPFGPGGFFGDDDII